MHGWILGFAAIAAASIAFAAPGDDDDANTTPCPRGNAVVVERFISAECAACWTDASTAQPRADEWLLDWIVPSSRGDEAPLSSAAPPEARARAGRALRSAPGGDRASVQRSAAHSASPLQLRVAAGPAWNGYFGVQIDASGRAAAGSSVWVALVEVVEAGTDGTPVPRQLVRTVSGPLPADELRDGQPWQHLLAMRWPETAKPARLRARAWIEDARGRIIAMAGERCGTR